MKARWIEIGIAVIFLATVDLLGHVDSERRAEARSRAAIVRWQALNANIKAITAHDGLPYVEQKTGN